MTGAELEAIEARLMAIATREPWGFVYDGSSAWSVGPASDPQLGHIVVHDRDDERAKGLCAFIASARDDARALVAEVRRLHEVERRHDALYAHFRDVHAALGEWDDKELTAAGSVRRLVANVERLRGLIKDAESTACFCSPAMESGCHWCEAHVWESECDGRFGEHEPDCPAFTEGGDVR